MRRSPRRVLRVATPVFVLLGLVACGGGDDGAPVDATEAEVPESISSAPVVDQPPEDATAAELGSKVFPLSAAPMLDGPQRDRWQRPDEVVAALRLRPGDRVADVGCGTGYFALRFLEAVGAEGHVLAIDIQQGMLDILEERIYSSALSRVTLRCSAATQPLVEGDDMNVVFCANTLKEVPDEDQAAFVRSMADGLVPGGRLVVLDWLPRPMQLGPPVEHRIAPDRVRELAAGAGLTLVEDVHLLPTHAFLVFTKGE